MNESSENVRKAYPDGSFARLFWEEQLKAASVSDSKQVRWHPLLIKWCLNLKLISSASYHTMHSSEFLWLPSERTSRDYTNYFTNQPGFQPDLNEQLAKEADVKQKVCCITGRQKKIKEDLVYNKTTGKLLALPLLVISVTFCRKWKRNTKTTMYNIHLLQSILWC